MKLHQLDQPTQQSIARAEAQWDRGEGKPWNQVRGT